MSIIARNSLSASGSSGEASFAFAFALYAALVRGGGGFGGASSSSSSSSSEMTTPLLTRDALLVDSVCLDVDGLARVFAGSSSSSVSESFNADLSLSFDREGLGSGLGAALDVVGGSTDSTLILRVSGAGLGAAGFALLKKSSFPEGFGFAGSTLISGLMSFGSDLTTGWASLVIEGAFDKPGSLFLEVEEWVTEDFAFADDRVRWRSVRFCGMKRPLLGLG
jgi:hypothetical protein